MLRGMVVPLVWSLSLPLAGGSGACESGSPSQADLEAGPPAGGQGALLQVLRVGLGPRAPTLPEPLAAAYLARAEHGGPAPPPPRASQGAAAGRQLPARVSRSHPASAGMRFFIALCFPVTALTYTPRASQPMPQLPPRPQADPAHDALWAELALLPCGAPLPAGLPATFYSQAASYLKGAQYAERLAQWARHLPPEK